MFAKLLVIDDDETWCQALKLLLVKQGFQVEVAHDALSGLKKAYSFTPAVILLDLRLPGMDGREVCRRLREVADVPIIMLTAFSSQEYKLETLELGADDYLVKTVSSGELVARIRAIMRRFSRQAPNFLGSEREALFVQDSLVVDFDKHEVTVDGERVDLSPTEFKLLSILVRYRGRVLPHEFLLNEVWGPDCSRETTTLRLYIGYLRRKLERGPAQGNLIQNEWGVGYRFG